MQALSHGPQLFRNIIGTLSGQWTSTGTVYCKLERRVSTAPIYKQCQTCKLACRSDPLHTLPTFNPRTLPRTSVVTGTPSCSQKKRSFRGFQPHPDRRPSKMQICRSRYGVILEFPLGTKSTNSTRFVCWRPLAESLQ